MSQSQRPIAVVNSVAPIRVCDNGCWTDTWFAGHGQVFNIAVYPHAEVQVSIYPPGDGPRLMLHAENFGERYEVGEPAPPWGRHPLLEAAIAYMGVPRELRLEVTIHSEAPAGAGTGTSAAVTVALVGALDALTPGRLTPHEAAAAAQKVETEMLHRQCGVQDQLASAYGGINFIDMFVYPHASVSPILVPDPVWWELERRLALVYLGRSHDSSAIHETVIRSLENAGPDSPAIVELRQTAPRSRDALYAGDFAALGRAMTESTEAQGRLHADLVGSAARRVIEIARGARGTRLEGERRRRRGRLDHAAVRRGLRAPARARPRGRAGRRLVPPRADLPEPARPARLAAGGDRLSGGRSARPRLTRRPPPGPALRGGARAARPRRPPPGSGTPAERVEVEARAEDHLQPAVDHHLDADDHQHRRERDLQVAERLDHPGEREVQASAGRGSRTRCS